MLKKAIKLTDTAAIEDALKAVNGRATSFTITNADQVRRAARNAQRDLDVILPKAAQKGARAIYAPVGPSAKAYKYRAKSTLITLERKAAGWVLVAVEETVAYPSSSDLLKITLTPDQHMAACVRAVAEIFDSFRVSHAINTLSAHERLALLDAVMKKTGRKRGARLTHAVLSGLADLYDEDAAR